MSSAASQGANPWPGATAQGQGGGGTGTPNPPPPQQAQWYPGAYPGYGAPYGTPPPPGWPPYSPGATAYPGYSGYPAPWAYPGMGTPPPPPPPPAEESPENKDKTKNEEKSSKSSSEKKSSSDKKSKDKSTKKSSSSDKKDTSGQKKDSSSSKDTNDQKKENTVQAQAADNMVHPQPYGAPDYNADYNAYYQAQGYPCVPYGGWYGPNGPPSMASNQAYAQNAAAESSDGSGPGSNSNSPVKFSGQNKKNANYNSVQGQQISMSLQQPPDLSQPPPNFNHPPPNFCQPPPNFNQPPPILNQPPPQQYQQTPPHHQQQQANQRHKQTPQQLYQQQQHHNQYEEDSSQNRGGKQSKYNKGKGNAMSNSQWSNSRFSDNFGDKENFDGAQYKNSDGSLYRNAENAAYKSPDGSSYKGGGSYKNSESPYKNPDTFKNSDNYYKNSEDSFYKGGQYKGGSEGAYKNYENPSYKKSDSSSYKSRSDRSDRSDSQGPSSRKQETKSSKPSKERSSAPDAAGGDWPESLKNYVGRCFARCKTELDKDQVEICLKGKLTAAANNGTLWSKNWDEEPLPSVFSESENVSAQNKSKWNSTNDSSGFNSSAPSTAVKHEKKGANKKYPDAPLYGGPNRGMRSHNRSESSSPARSRSRSPPYRRGKRENRRERQSSDDEDHKDFIKLDKKRGRSPLSMKDKDANKKFKKPKADPDCHFYSEHGLMHLDADLRTTERLEKRAARFSAMGGQKKSAPAASHTPRGGKFGRGRGRGRGRGQGLDLQQGSEESQQRVDGYSGGKNFGGQKNFGGVKNFGGPKNTFGGPKKKKQLHIAESVNAAFSVDGDDIDWTSIHIVGTSTSIEKEYLRLTSAPDPDTVRTPETLKKSLEHIKRQWVRNQDYYFACNQLKSIRQDLTVQGIRDAFTVQVYETHSRIALEKGDHEEFNQCQSQLKQLYSEVGGDNAFEFIAYRLLYYIFTKNTLDITALMAGLTTHHKADECILFALHLRKAWSLRNYHKFFQLYRTAPKMAGYLVDWFAERERKQALRIMLRVYRPGSIDVSFVRSELALGADEDWEKFEGGVGLVYTDATKTKIDCKTSVVDVPTQE